MEALAVNIRQNMEAITERIQRAAQSAGRRGEDVRLVVVTKAQPIQVVHAAVTAGARILGENYPEETLPKIEAIGDAADVAWHMIGHLQSRKAGLVAEHFDMLHSLDSLRLAEKLERQLAQKDRILPVLLEMNVSGEESKFGFQGWNEARWDLLFPEIEALLALRHLSLCGLMTMPPLYDDPDQTRPFFNRLRRLAEFLGSHFGKEYFRELSMGTSTDFEAAVREGATYVRIGTAIVGQRPKKAE